jgi:hypothetical protein
VVCLEGKTAMSWVKVADHVQINSGVTVSVSFDALCASFISQGDFRALLEEKSGLAITEVNSVPGFNFFIGTAKWDVTAGELRRMSQAVLDEIRSYWTVACTHAAVTDIEIQSSGGFLPEVSTQTTLSLAAIAVILVVGFVIYRNLKNDLGRI